MAKKTKDLTIELVAEETVSPHLSDESRTDTQLDSILSLSEGRPENGEVPANHDGRGTGAFLFPSPLEGKGQGGPTGNANGVIVGKLVDIDQTGTPYVDFQGNPSADLVLARTTIRIENFAPNQEVVLMFENGDLRKPVVLGVLKQSGDRTPESDRNNEAALNRPADVVVDGERLTFTAKNEIVLKCGKASITLTKAGKILIRGAYLLSRSSGVNRVKGGSVQIN